MKAMVRNRIVSLDEVARSLFPVELPVPAVSTSLGVSW
jgi:hypothetical protein